MNTYVVCVVIDYFFLEGRSCKECASTTLYACWRASKSPLCLSGPPPRSPSRTSDWWRRPSHGRKSKGWGSFPNYSSNILISSNILFVQINTSIRAFVQKLKFMNKVRARLNFYSSNVILYDKSNNRLGAGMSELYSAEAVKADSPHGRAVPFSFSREQISLGRDGWVQSRLVNKCLCFGLSNMFYELL